MTTAASGGLRQAKIILEITLLGMTLIAAFILYYLLYQSVLVPRFTSIWGFIGVVLMLAWDLAELFGIEIPAGMILALPIILNELFLAIWLIVKGFNMTEMVSDSARPAVGKV